MVKTFPSTLSFVIVALFLAGVARGAAPKANVVSGTMVDENGQTIAEFTFEPSPGVEVHNLKVLVLEPWEVELFTSKFAAGLTTPQRRPVKAALRAKIVVVAKTTGKPMPGARVALSSTSWCEAVTDKDGVAMFDVVNPMVYNSFDIRAESYARKLFAFDLAGASGTFEQKFELDRGGIIRGVVVDKSGKPVSDVEADCSVLNWTGDDTLPGWAARTDKNGNFQERFAPLDRLIGIRFRKDGYAPQELDDDHQVLLTTAKPQADLRIVLVREPAGGSVAGIVTDISGQPIAGAKVVKLRNIPEPGGATTDAKGRFRLDDLGTEKVRGRVIGVAAKGFAPQAFDAKLGTVDHPSEIVVKLEPGHTLHGRVVDERGQPVAKVRFDFRSASYPHHIDPSGTNPTGAEGTFAFGSLPADAQISITAPLGQCFRNVTLPLDSSQPITYTVKSQGEIRGHVVDATTGKPLKTFYVRLARPDTSQPGEQVYTEFLGESYGLGNIGYSANGQFKIGPLANRCRAKLIVDADGYERNVVPAATAQYADQATDLKIVMLPIRDSDYCTLSARLVDHRGNGIAGEMVHVIASPREYTRAPDPNFDELSMELASQSYVDRYVTVRTGADGEFTVDKIPPHEFLQVLYRDELGDGRWVSREQTRPGSKQSITIRTNPPATIHATIDRKKLADAQTVFLSAINNHIPIAQHALYLEPSQSSFEFTSIRPGQYSLQVNTFKTIEKDGHPHRQPVRLTKRQVNLAPGEDCKINLP